MPKSRHHKSRRRNNRKNSSWGKIAAATFIPCAVLGAGAMGMLHFTGQEKIDKNFCYTRDDQFKAAIFVDNSMVSLSEAQLRDYRAGFERAYKFAPANAKMLIYTTANDVGSSVVKPVFTICKPPSTVTEQATLEVSAKPLPYLQRQSKEAFKAYQLRISMVMKDAKDMAKTAYASPILEQLRGISRSTDFAGHARSLTIITDGIQNSDVAQFCKTKGAMPSFQTFQRRADYKMNVQPEPFTNTNVSLLLVESGPLPQIGLMHCTQNEKRRW